MIDGALPQNLHHGIIDLVGSGADPAQQTAPADHGTEGIHPLPLPAQGVQHQAGAHLQLVVDHGILLDNSRVVLQAFAPFHLVIAVPGDFGGSGAGIDYQNLIHVRYLVLLSQALWLRPNSRPFSKAWRFRGSRLAFFASLCWMVSQTISGAMTSV